jgi:hypothetical protein
MTFLKLVSNSLVRPIALVACVVMLAGCASEDIDVTTGSRLEQPPTGVKPEPPVEAGDIAIAGQDFSHAIRQLPEVADAAKPPLVQFTGVTSIVNGPVDTEPYTDLLRDRLLLGDREKLRFVERQLPPLTSHKKVRKQATPPATDEGNGEPDYQVLAELRGKIDADFYRIQIEFVNAHTGQVLFNGVYRIRKEMPGSSPNGSAPNGQQAVSDPNAMPMTRQGADGGDSTAPQQVTPPPGGWHDANTGAPPVPPVFHE